jgi:His-Xaa-Ser system protein HxsD
MSDPERPIIAFGLDRAHLALPVDLALYSLDAVMRAAYKFTDRCFVWLERTKGTTDGLNVFFVGRAPDAELRPLILELQNELLDQQLRCRLEAQFGAVRALIVAQAFSEGNLLDPQADDGDYHADPLGAGEHR